MDVNKNKLLNKLYNNPDSAACYAGQNRLYEEARKLDPSIKKRDITHFLEGDRTYTLHKPRRVRFKRSRVVPAGFMTDVQVDLADFQKLSRENKGFNYILVGIDVLSKRVFAVAVKTKKFDDMRYAFDKLFEQMPMLPHRIFSDRGKEFENAEMRKYFEDLDIQKHKAHTSTVKAALAERCIRMLKQRLYRYFSQKHTVKWIDVLPKIVNALNNSKSRITGVKPNEITTKNAQEIWLKVYGGEHTFKKSKFKEGDHVRLAKYKSSFEKSYLPNYSDEIYQVYDIKKGNPYRYGIKDDQNEPFDTRFYAEDLAKTRKDAETTYRIEKVIKTRTKNGIKEHLVRFLGYKEPEWIRDVDIER